MKKAKRPPNPKTEALLRHLRDEFENAVNLSKKIPPEAMSSAGEQDNIGALADLIASFLELSGSRTPTYS